MRFGRNLALYRVYLFCLFFQEPAGRLPRQKSNTLLHFQFLTYSYSTIIKLAFLFYTLLFPVTASKIRDFLYSARSFISDCFSEISESIWAHFASRNFAMDSCSESGGNNTLKSEKDVNDISLKVVPEPRTSKYSVKLDKR